METIQTCLMCGTPTTKSCSSCKSVSYCNKEHQKKDWRAHKEYCLKVKAAGANTFDAILFAVNETKPRLVKVPWELSRVSEDDVQYQKLDTDVWFKYTNAAVRPLYFHRLGINGPELGRALCFKYDDNFSINGSPLNRCIVNVTEGKARHQWCGNIVALRMKSLYSYDFYDNVDMEQDLKLFVTYFEEYGRVKPVD